MANITTENRERQLAYKKLVSKIYTDLIKGTANEYGAHALKLDYTDVWADEIPYDDPFTALTTDNLDGHAVVEGELVQTGDGLIAQGRDYKLVRFLDATDTTTFFIPRDINAPKLEITDRLDGFVSDKYGQKYTPRLFYNGHELNPGDQGWFFDCDTGILSFLIDQRNSTNKNVNKSDMSKFTIRAYRYIGRTVKDAVGETFDEDLGNLIIQPNKIINYKADTNTTSQP